MFNQIASFFGAILLFFINLFPFCGLDLKDGMNPDPRTYGSDIRTEGYIYKDGDFKMPVRIYSPENPEEGKEYPLIVFLHGAGQRGTDNRMQVLPLMLDAIEEYGEECYVVMPQIAKNSSWNNDAADKALNAIIEDFVFENCQIDYSRMYLTGLSMGGNGTYDQLLRHPGRYAAAIALCGYHGNLGEGSPEFAKLVDIPLLMAHNSGDTTVSVENSRTIYNGIKKAGGEKAVYHEYNVIAHNVWDGVYSDQATWEWLFAYNMDPA